MSQLVLAGSLKDFFRMLVGEVVKRQKVSIEEITEFYVVNLLSDYAQAERLFTQEIDGKRESEPLAMLYHRALQQEREERVRTLRRLGDVSLYTAGYFNGSLKDRAVGPDYYVQMGKNAYSALADMASNSSYAGVYQELCLKFSSLVEVLEEISARGMAATGPQGQLQVFETWSRTGNGRLEQVLIDSGVLPAKKLLAN
ncbi:MAG: hypothetical protein U0228_27425 [Myxococcaceae bacterium]